MIVALAALFGLFLGVCFALLRDFLDDSVNKLEDARRLLGGVPTLGVIPMQKDTPLLTAASPTGGLMESYRVLRSHLRFAAAAEEDETGEPLQLQSIMVTSTTPQEGKSTTAANLAVVMALDGKWDGLRVILVDADLRKPTVHEKFGAIQAPGLTNVLIGKKTLEEALQNTSIENLRILTAGTTPPNPVELLNSSKMAHVQDELRKIADIIIFDCPPCVNIADAQLLAETVDGVVYVVNMSSTRKSMLKRGYEAMRHARLLGAVYNKYEQKSSADGYGYGYGYGYNAYNDYYLTKGDRSYSDWEALQASKDGSTALPSGGVEDASSTSAEAMTGANTATTLAEPEMKPMPAPKKTNGNGNGTNGGNGKTRPKE